jgi:hypothetical protein
LWVRTSVSKFGGTGKFRPWRICRILKNSEKLGENQKNSAETQLRRARNRKNSKNQNSTALAELSAKFNPISIKFGQ